MPESAAISITNVIHKYDVEKKSIQVIASELGTYPVKIFRLLKKSGHPLRSRSECQKVALANGKTHPTKGRTRTGAEKKNIGDGRMKAWQRTGTEAHSIRSKKAWMKKTAREKTDFNKKGHKAVLEASKKGSKLERYLNKWLIESGYEVKMHIEALISNEKMHLDLFLPKLKTAIEVDGPSHHLDIWGREKLLKYQERDRIKTGLLISSGYNIVRIKNLAKSMSNARQRATLQKLLEVLKTVDKNGAKQYHLEVE